MVDGRNGEFAHSPLTRKECDTGYYLLHGDHQRQGLYQSEDLGKCCFWVGHTRAWLYGDGFLCEDWFNLVELYEKWSNEMGVRNGKRAGKEAVENQKGIHNPAYAERVHEWCVRGGERVGMSHAVNSTGICSPKSRRNSYVASCRKVEVTFSGGRIGTYPSIRFVSLALGVSVTTVQRWCYGKAKPYRRHRVSTVRITSCPGEG